MRSNESTRHSMHPYARWSGNYSEYVAAKAEAVARQWAAYEKQQKEIARQVRSSLMQDVTLCVMKAASL